MRIGLIGCGRLAEIGYVPALAMERGTTLTAVADPDGGRRAHLADLVGESVSTFADAAALIEGADVDALVLASPASTHVADAEWATAAGLPVLVEKPPAPDGAGAARLATLGPTVRVGFNRRFDPGVREVRAATPRAGALDLELEIRYRRASWGAHLVRDEVILDLAPHLLDLARWVSGSEIREVTATELTPDRATLSLVLGRGRATIRARADSIHAEQVAVRDAAGTTVARHRAGGSLAAIIGRLRPSPGVHPLVASLAAQLDSFATVVRGGQDPALGTTVDGVAVMAAVDAARTSAAAAGRPTLITDPMEPSPC
ncbi:MAG: Gfo/Idh/MocA family oxidoreductase [Acidimicrobiales bacterium]|nr:Gfo/Idh/MocA family oxidoreductase [Acidimicrobiales bacterium]